MDVNQSIMRSYVIAGVIILILQESRLFYCASGEKLWEKMLSIICIITF